jgi:hypothetical protein
MDDWKLVAIIVGVFGALLGVYFRESLRKSFYQKTIASKLEAEVGEILRELISSDSIKLLVVAKLWNEEREKALLEKGAEGFMEVEKKYEQKLKELKVQIESGDKETDEALGKNYENYRKMPDKLFAYHVQQFEIVRDSILKNIGFLSENEAAELSWDTAARVVSVRNYYIKLIHQNILFLLTLREMEKLDLDAIRSFVYSIAEQSIRLSLHLEPLRTKAVRIRAKSLICLAIQNMIGRP